MKTPIPERVGRLMEQTDDAYSFDNYGASGWRGAIRMLIRRGYSDREIEAILRSKWTRWAGDASGKRHGYNTGRDLEKFLDSNAFGTPERHDARLANDIKELVLGTFGSEE